MLSDVTQFISLASLRPRVFALNKKVISRRLAQEPDAGGAPRPKALSVVPGSTRNEATRDRHKCTISASPAENKAVVSGQKLEVRALTSDH